MKSSSNKKLIAYLCLLAGIFALGMTAMFVRWANAPGPMTAFYRLAIASLLTCPFFIFQLRRGAKIPLAHFLFPVLGGVLTAGDFAFWYTSVGYTTAANATLLGNTAPLWVALIAALFFHERLTRAFWLGLTLALSGAALIVSRDFLLHPSLGLGDMLALTAAFFYGGYMLVTQRGRARMDAFPYWWVTSFSATISLLIINLVLRNSFSGYGAQTWLVFVSSAFVSQMVGYLAISYALGHLPASVVSPTMIGQPIVTTILAIPLLGESPNSWQVAGGALALAGIYLVNRAHIRAEKIQPSTS